MGGYGPAAIGIDLPPLPSITLPDPGVTLTVPLPPVPTPSTPSATIIVPTLEPQPTQATTSVPPVVPPPPPATTINPVPPKPSKAPHPSQHTQTSSLPASSVAGGNGGDASKTTFSGGSGGNPSVALPTVGPNSGNNSTSPSTSDMQQPSSSGPSTALIAGASVGVVAGIFFILAGLLIWRKRQQRKEAAQFDDLFSHNDSSLVASSGFAAKHIYARSGSDHPNDNGVGNTINNSHHDPPNHNELRRSGGGSVMVSMSTPSEAGSPPPPPLMPREPAMPGMAQVQHDPRFYQGAEVGDMQQYPPQRGPSYRVPYHQQPYDYNPYNGYRG
ncbi:hypothetical protein EDD11_002600 [Mortierella claussenii]|nr:hypothetical protein EDD11_002600 [Mortierella claussenii]